MTGGVASLATPRGDLGGLFADLNTLAFDGVSLQEVFCFCEPSLTRRTGCWEGNTGVFSLSAILSSSLRAASLLEQRRPLLSGINTMYIYNASLSPVCQQSCSIWTLPLEAKNSTVKFTLSSSTCLTSSTNSTSTAASMGKNKINNTVL